MGSEIQLSSRDARSLLGLNEEKIVLFFGHLAPFKGLESLVEAQSLIQQQRKDVGLVIAGGNHIRLTFDYLSQLKKLALEHQASVIFTGYVPNDWVPLLFRAADLVVFPCLLVPGSSGCVLMARQYGKPLVTTTAVAVEEGVHHLVDSYIIPSPSPGLIATAILGLLSDESLLKFLGGNLGKSSIPISEIADSVGSVYQGLSS
jgi:glycosyltransferase involved in cell wall biosynthesis